MGWSPATTSTCTLTCGGRPPQNESGDASNQRFSLRMTCQEDRALRALAVINVTTRVRLVRNAGLEFVRTYGGPEWDSSLAAFETVTITTSASAHPGRHPRVNHSEGGKAVLSVRTTLHESCEVKGFATCHSTPIANIWRYGVNLFAAECGQSSVFGVCSSGRLR